MLSSRAAWIGALLASALLGVGQAAESPLCTYGTGVPPAQIVISGDVSCAAGLVSVTVAANLVVNCTSPSTLNGIRFVVEDGISLDFVGSEIIIRGCNTQDQGGALYAYNNSIITFEAATTFLDNSAWEGGTIYTLGDIEFASSATFTNNSATKGGAILHIVTVNGNLRFVGDTLFSDNKATLNGGALAVDGAIFYGLSLSSSSTTDFGSKTGVTQTLGHGNIAFASAATFSRNSAGEGGGAISNSDGTINFWSSASFINNTASLEGGAISNSITIGEDGHIEFIGDALFKGNEATEHMGGAVYTDGTLIFDSYSSFEANSAGTNGGAIFIEGIGGNYSRRSVEFGDLTDFVGNKAGNDGGAILANEYFDMGIGEVQPNYYGGVISTGAINMRDNTAVRHGGAAALYLVSDPNVQGQMMQLQFADIRDNTAGAQGGAVFADGCAVMTWRNVSFVGNTAGGDGGAAYVINCPLQWLNSTASSNTASQAGGMLAFLSAPTISGNYVIPRGYLERDLSFIENVDFYNNAAIAGGSVYIESCTVDVQNSTFIDGAASLGAAIYLGPFSDLQINESFIFNHHAGSRGGSIYVAIGSSLALNGTQLQNSTTDGPGGAIFCENGATVDLSRASILNSEAGSYGGSVAGQLACQLTVTETVFQGSNATCCFFSSAYSIDASTASCMDISLGDNSGLCCSKYQYWSNYTNACEECDPSKNACSSIGTTLETLPLKAGYWRRSPVSTLTLRCWNQKACVGGPDSASLCAPGYEGPYCASCSPGRFQSSWNYACSECPDQTPNGLIAALTMLALVFLMTFIVITKVLLGSTVESERHKSRCSGFTPVAWLIKIPWNALRIALVTYQLVYQFFSVTSTNLPTLYQHAFWYSNVLNAEQGWIFSVHCNINTNFYSELYFKTIAPAVVLLYFFLVYRFGIWRTQRHVAAGESEGEVVLASLYSRFCGACLVLLFFIYTSVSTTVLQMFACDKLDDGSSFLRADYSIDCHSDSYHQNRIYAAFMLVVYPIGVPLLFLIFIYRVRVYLTHTEELTEHEVLQKRLQNGHLRSVRFLWGEYRERAYYWEVVESLRRLLLTGVIVFLKPGGTAQVSISVVLAFAALLITSLCHPYASKWDQATALVSGITIIFSMYCALLLQVDTFDSGSQKTALVTSSVAILLIGIFISSFCQMINLWREEGKLVNDFDTSVCTF